MKRVETTEAIAGDLVELSAGDLEVVVGGRSATRSGSASIFLELGGISGESQDKKLANELDIYS